MKNTRKNSHVLNIFLIFFLLFTFTVSAQEYDKKFDEKNRMTMVQKGDKFGFLDDIGDLQVPIIYDEAYNYNDGGYAIVKKDGKYGIINRYSDVVLPLSYDDIFPSISENLFIVLNNKLFGVVNFMKNPVVVLEPQFTKMKEFNGNLIAIAVKNGKYGIVDEYGEIITDFKYDRIYDFKQPATTFKIIDADGKAKYGVINSLGKVKGNLYDGIGNFDSSGRAIMRIGVKYGMVGMSGSEMLEPIYNGIDPVVDGKMLVLKNGKFGLLDEFDEWEDYTGEITYDTIITANKGDGLTPVKKWLTYGYIDESGKLAIPMVFEGYTKFEHGLALIVFNGKYGLINTKSQFVGKAEYEKVDGWKDGVYTVMKDGVWGTVDKTGIFKKKLTAEELAAQETEGDLIANIQASYNKIKEEEEKRNEVVYVAPKDLIELTFTEGKKVGTTEKLYDFTKVDTLYYTNENKQLAFIKEGDKFATVNGFLKVYNTDETPDKGGFTMRKIEKVNGKYAELKSNNTLIRENFDSYSKGFIMNSFVKDKDGYMACSPLELDFFDAEGSMLKSYQSSTHILVSATAIPGTNKYVVLGVRGVNKAPSYNEKRGQIFGISIFDKDLEQYSEFIEIRNMYYESWNINSQSTRVLITQDNEILMTFNRMDPNGNASWGSDDQHISKLDLDKLVNENKLEYLWHVQFDDYKVRNIVVKTDGSISGLLASPGSGELVSFTANANAQSKSEFTNSIRCKKTAEGKDQGLNYHKGNFELKNGKWITAGVGDPDFGYNNTIVLCYYDSDMSLIRQYRIPTKFNDFHLSEESYTYDVKSQYGYFGQDQDGATAFGGITGLKRPTMETNSKDFNELNFDNFVYQIIPGETENEIYLMTAYAIIKIDLTKFVECKLKGKIIDWGSSTSDDSSDDSDDSNSSSSTTSSSSTNGTKTNTASSSSNSTSKEKEFSGSVYFKYDMSGKDRPGEKLYIHSGSNASTITSTTPGSKATARCEKGKVYYSFTGKKSDMKEFMELSVDDCGKTFNYTDFK